MSSRCESNTRWLIHLQVFTPQTLSSAHFYLTTPLRSSTLFNISFYLTFIRNKHYSASNYPTISQKEDIIISPSFIPYIIISYPIAHPIHSFYSSHFPSRLLVTTSSLLGGGACITFLVPRTTTTPVPVS